MNAVALRLSLLAIPTSRNDEFLGPLPGVGP